GFPIGRGCFGVGDCPAARGCPGGFVGRFRRGVRVDGRGGRRGTLGRRRERFAVLVSVVAFPFVRGDESGLVPAFARVAVLEPDCFAVPECFAVFVFVFVRFVVHAPFAVHALVLRGERTFACRRFGSAQLRVVDV